MWLCSWDLFGRTSWLYSIPTQFAWFLLVSRDKEDLKKKKNASVKSFIFSERLFQCTSLMVDDHGHFWMTVCEDKLWVLVGSLNSRTFSNVKQWKLCYIGLQILQLLQALFYYMLRTSWLRMCKSENHASTNYGNNRSLSQG